jgi:hypothetical protein
MYNAGFAFSPSGETCFVLLSVPGKLSGDFGKPLESEGIGGRRKKVRPP